MTDKPRVELYRDVEGAYRWRAVARNGEVVATGAEGFTSKQSARQNIELSYGEDADVSDVTVQP